ncbi:ABC transporter permease [Streptococcus loxodontisalivarius]|uniref:Simple sugar transport system permease protein n=1 Tax=Streptococcus loxodontisalivarius TaxID=1349415 RepID=A0ABS2PPN4_9STRE|nr:ABC transporter permease [Streptococcus loxodontisalivarius]MBM7641861.1 simple sugar transport system permease protein [Streptococcus loxodontisalivarius]
MSKKTQSWAVPLIAVLLGMLLGAILMLAFGYDPYWAYVDLFNTAFGSVKNIGEILRAMGPLILIALGFSVASKAGFFNVGLPGQALAGWTASVWFALSFPDLPRFVSIICTVLVGLIAGGIAGAIPGILRAYLGTSEVIVTIMMNYIILYSANAIVRDGFPDSFMRSSEATNKVSEAASYQLGWFDGSRFNIGFFLALIAVALIWFMMKKTTTGYEITAVGLNPHAAEYAGMSSKRVIVMSMIISGALAGLGGTVEGLGTFENAYVQTSSLSIGWDGMAVALLASNSPIGIPFAALLYGVLSIGKTGMIGVPSEVIDVVSALIIFFVGANYIIKYYLQPRKKAVKGGKN